MRSHVRACIVGAYKITLGYDMSHLGKSVATKYRENIDSYSASADQEGRFQLAISSPLLKLINICFHFNYYNPKLVLWTKRDEAQ